MVRTSAVDPTVANWWAGARVDPRRLLIALSVAALVIVLLGDLFEGLTAIIPKPTVEGHAMRQLAQTFWADGEGNLWAWFSSVVDLGLGLILAVDALARRSRRTPWRAYAVLAAAAMYMSADETAQLHEVLGDFGKHLRFTSAWFALGIPLIVVIGVVLLRVSRRIDPVLRRRLIIAGAVFLSGAVGLEALGGAMQGVMGLAPNSLPYIAEVTVEELLEFAGSLIGVWAALQALPLAFVAGSALRSERTLPAEHRRAA